MIRPKRVVTETCSRCRRPGWTHENGFELLSEDEFEKIMGHALEKIKGLPAGYEPMYVGAGSSIWRSIEEARDYCREYGVTGVGFDFNGKPVFVTAESDPEQVGKEWWKLVYGRTYEEDMANR